MCSSDLSPHTMAGAGGSGGISRWPPNTAWTRAAGSMCGWSTLVDLRAITKKTGATRPEYLAGGRLFTGPQAGAGEAAMLSSVVGIIRGLMGSNWITVALVAFAAMIALLWARREQIQKAELSYQLLAEESRHSVTRTELAAARAEAAALRAMQ